MSSSNKYLTVITPDEVHVECKNPVDEVALGQVKQIFTEIMPNNDSKIDPKALLSLSKRFGDITSSDSDSFLVTKEQCQQAFDSLDKPNQQMLYNIYNRVQAFANLQRASIQDCETDIPGGKAGHTVSPCSAAGCYAPGGRYPLPSSVIMTACTARAAGCQTVVLCSPRPATITLAAAHVCQVDYMIPIGGAQAIASMAYGLPAPYNIPRCDVIVGPGNKWVTAAKSIVQGYCGIDMLAGPSEVLVICDDTANSKIIAADLIAQAEHDVVARAILVTDSATIIDQVEEQVEQQLKSLPEPNQTTATQAFLQQSFSVLCQDIKQCIEVSDAIAPEHLEIQCRDSQSVGEACNHYGGLFIGECAAEVLGDYGAGPNHTLPTGGTGRYTGGLSVFHFLRIRTYMRIDNPQQAQDMVHDSVTMARQEGLEGHARAAEARLLDSTDNTDTTKS